MSADYFKSLETDDKAGYNQAGKNIFKPTKKDKKVQISATIDESNFNLINEILEKDNLQFSTALNDILTYFRKEWEDGRI